LWIMFPASQADVQYFDFFLLVCNTHIHMFSGVYAYAMPPIKGFTINRQNFDYTRRSVR
jgi:hypothetical protein